MIELLRELDIFDGVDDETLAEFATKSTEEHLAVGDPLWTEGKPIERFLVLAEGTVEWSRRLNGVDVDRRRAGGADLRWGDQHPDR